MVIIEERFKDVVRGFLGDKKYSVEDPNFWETPERVWRVWNDLIKSLEYVESEAEKILSKTFPSTYSGIVLVKDVEAVGMCPHHLLPVLYKISFAYMPNGKVLGLSKVIRFITLVVKYVCLQEDLTERILDMFQKYVEPRGQLVVVKGLHMCMKIRGVEEESEVVTMGVRGELHQEEVKLEVFHMLTK